ncbi:MAG: recombination regulator RecX [Vicinamibacteria bacterium]|nr:recombination regulator RecX [Vicinamibacteria bacterium]
MSLGLARPDSAWEQAIARLSRRDFSEAELRRALGRDGYAEPEVEAVLIRLREKRLLDDARYARRRAQRGLAERGMGRLRVRAELRSRGVHPKLADVAVAEALAEAPEPVRIEALARAWWRTHKSGEPQARVRRLAGWLVRRGFPASAVADKLRHLFPRDADGFGEIADAPEED